MRHLALALLLIAAPVLVAADAEREPCEGCLILSPEKVEQMKRDFALMLRQAFELGQADQKERCASLI
jgi:hypothetical protein